MSNCKKFLLLSVLTLALIGLSGGTALAGVEGSVPDEVIFSLGIDTVFVDGTTAFPDNELATLDFNVKFDVAQEGELHKAVIKLEYDPDYLTFVAARPDDDWNVTQPNDTTLTVDLSGNPAVITYVIGPVSSIIPADTTLTQLAEFDFVANCQAELSTNEVTIVGGLNETYVNRQGVADEDDYYVFDPEDPNRLNHGSVSVDDYVGSVWLADVDGVLELPGVLGTEVLVPIYAQSNFKLGGIRFYFSFDNSMLEITPDQPSSDYFNLGSVQFDDTLGLVEVALYNIWSVGPPRREFPVPEVVANVKFRVLDSWEGDSTLLSMSSDVDAPAMYVGVREHEWCTDIDPTAFEFNDGFVKISDYEAEISTECGTISDLDDDATITIKLTNNFPAGRAQDAIVLNLDLGTDLQADGFATGAVLDFGLFTYNEPEGQEISLRNMNDNGFVELSDVPANLVSFNITKSGAFEPPTTYEDRFYSIFYQTPFNVSPYYDARVTDTTGLVMTTESDATLSWDAPEIEYLMGEYYCPYVQAGDCNVTQTYYTQHNFTLDDFRVKIEVSGPHYMYDVIPIEGVEVESFDEVGYKWVILSTVADTSFEQAPTDGRTAFASITYTRSGGSNLAAKETAGSPDEPSLPGPGPWGYWVTRTSTISFTYDDPYYMEESVTGLSHHVVAITNNVVSKWWHDYTDPNENQLLFGLQMPEDFELLQNYPNPFNPSTEIAFGLPNTCQVELSIYNIAGQLVETLVAERMEAGWHSVTWDGAGFASGIYLYRIQAGDYTESQKMILLK